MSDQATGASGGRMEVDCGDAIVVLEGLVVEIFLNKVGMQRRWHVRQLTVEAKPSRNGKELKLAVGTNQSLTRSQWFAFDVAIEHDAALTALFEEAKRRRDADPT